MNLHDLKPAIPDDIADAIRWLNHIDAGNWEYKWTGGTNLSTHNLRHPQTPWSPPTDYADYIDRWAQRWRENNG